MDSNTSTTDDPEAHPDETPIGPDGLPAGLDGLATAIGELAAQDPDELSDAMLAALVLAVRRLTDQLDGAWLRFLAATDARGAAGAEQGVQAGSTAGWLRARLRMSPGRAGRAVRTARALHRGPLSATARALAAGEVSVEHATVLAEATKDLPVAKVAEAEAVLIEAARRVDPPRLRQATCHLRTLIDPERAEERARVRLQRRGLWLSATYDGMVAVDGLLDPETGETVCAAILPLARPAGPDEERTPAQRRADALGELARQAVQDGRVPQLGGLRPQLTVTVELASLLTSGGVGGLGGTGSWGGVLPAETVRRLACDATVTRAVVHRHHPNSPDDPSGDGDDLAARLRSAVALLPPPLGAPAELLDLGRATRVISPALRRALAARDGGCIAIGCDRPAAWTDAHHLVHWLDGGPTSLANLGSVCREHHRAAHDGGWQLTRSDGRLTLVPPGYRRAPPAA